MYYEQIRRNHEKKNRSIAVTKGAKKQIHIQHRSKCVHKCGKIETRTGVYYICRSWNVEKTEMLLLYT